MTFWVKQTTQWENKRNAFVSFIMRVRTLSDLQSFETALIHELLYQLYDVQGIRTAWVFSKSTLLLYIEQKDT